MAVRQPALLTLVLMLVAVSKTYDYNEILKLSLLFYESQRSGHLPLDNRIPWRGDSALQDKGQNGEDLTGGFYDAGDFVKFGFTMASTVTILSWGMLSYKDAYQSAGQYNNCLQILRWAADYFIKCHVSPNELYGQVGDFTLDHAFWGRPEDLNMSRPAYKIDEKHPGSDLAGETAAALASISIIYSDVDKEYSAKCRKHAQQLYNFAINYKGLFHDALIGAGQYYQSSGYGDELAWAAAWLYRATNDTSYRMASEQLYEQYKLDQRPDAFFYNNKIAGVQALLAELTRKEKYIKAAEAFCQYSVHEQKRTPKGLIYIDKFGTLCHAANVAFLCIQVATLQRPSSEIFRKFGEEQIHYMLGNSGRSYVVGFGENYPKQPHHAASSCEDRPARCDWDAFNKQGPNPQILFGALVSGPDQNDYYEDKRAEYVYNEVTLDYNGGFQTAVAALLHWQLKEEKRMPNQDDKKNQLIFSNALPHKSKAAIEKR